MRRHMHVAHFVLASRAGFDTLWGVLEIEVICIGSPPPPKKKKKSFTGRDRCNLICYHPWTFQRSIHTPVRFVSHGKCCIHSVMKKSSKNTALPFKEKWLWGNNDTWEWKQRGLDIDVEYFNLTAEVQPCASCTAYACAAEGAELADKNALLFDPSTQYFRYFAIVHPLKHVGWKRFLIPLSMAFTVCFNLPRFFELRYSHQEEDVIMTEFRKDPNYVTYYIFWAKFVLVEMIPYVTIIVLNSSIMYKIYKSSSFQKKYCVQRTLHQRPKSPSECRKVKMSVKSRKSIWIFQFDSVTTVKGKAKGNDISREMGLTWEGYEIRGLMSNWCTYSSGRRDLGHTYTALKAWSAWKIGRIAVVLGKQRFH